MRKNAFFHQFIVRELEGVFGERHEWEWECMVKFNGKCWERKREASRSFCVCVCVYWCVCTSVCVSVHISRSFSAIWPFLDGQNTHTHTYKSIFSWISPCFSFSFVTLPKNSLNSVSINWLKLSYYMFLMYFKKYHFNNFSNMATL